MAQLSLKKRLKQALDEDSAFSDVTTRAIPGFRKARMKMVLLAKQHGVFCGAFLLKPVFHMLDSSVRVHVKVRDGSKVRPNKILAVVNGKAFALLAGERLYLNLAGKLSGIATQTQKFVQKTKGTRAKIFDTRKTTPLWRDLERVAVRCGGGQNHRFSLGDAVLIKDNHLGFVGSKKMDVAEIYYRKNLRQKNGSRLKFIEIEAQSTLDVKKGLGIGADIILLDNMSTNRIKTSMKMVRAARKTYRAKKPQVEISGGVTLKNVRAMARLGVDRISVGSLTHSAPSLDLSMEVI